MPVPRLHHGKTGIRKARTIDPTASISDRDARLSRGTGVADQDPATYEARTEVIFGVIRTWNDDPRCTVPGFGKTGRPAGASNLHGADRHTERWRSARHVVEEAVATWVGH